MSDLNKKLYFSGLSALIFLAVSMPQVYSRTNALVDSNGSCPTYKSKLLHLLVFFALSLIVMQFAGKSSKPLATMAKYAFYGSLVYFLLSSTELYMLTNSVVGGLADDGCPTMKGIVVHTVVYMAVLVGLMSLPKE